MGETLTQRRRVGEDSLSDFGFGISDFGFWAGILIRNRL